MQRYLLITLAAAVLVAGILLVFVSQAPHGVAPVARAGAAADAFAAPHAGAEPHGKEPDRHARVEPG